MSNKIKIEKGKRREFSTGAKSQAAAGKGTPVLVPGDAIIDIAKHFENGAAIYGPRNWEKGIPLSEQLNSLERHLQQEKMGMTDEPHARALAWRAICYLATKLRIEKGLLPAELDDMPMYLNPETQNYTSRGPRVPIVEVKATIEPVEETIEETVAINEELAEEFRDKPVEEFKDTVKSPALNDGKWYCSGDCSCLRRGRSNTAPNMFCCGEHIDKWRKEHENVS